MGDTAPTTPATYYYYLCVDPLTDEQNTDNNCSPTPAEVIVQSTVPEPEETEEPETPEEEEPAAQPDLTITITVVSPTPVQSGATVALQVQVKNEGTAPASQEAVSMYRHASETANPKVGGVRIRTTSTGKILAPNASVRGTFRSPAPTVSTTKQYYYYACVDTADGEHNIDNNCTTPVQVTVQPKTTPPTETDDTEEEPEEPTYPDLSVTDTTATPRSLQSSYIITVQAKITNTGTAPAETETVRIYRHVRKTNNPKTGGTREQGTAATGTLATGNAVTITSTHTAPTVSETKRYYYYVCVDTLPDEQNTDNNCSRTPAEVVVRVKPEDPGASVRKLFCRSRTKYSDGR